VHIDIIDFENAVTYTKCTKFVSRKLRNYRFAYEELSKPEYDKWIITIYNELINLQDHPESCAGPHRRYVWENGWGKNFESADTMPGYFGKYPVVRWRRELIKPRQVDFEYNMLTMLQYWLFEKYMYSAKSIYEFGCGTGHNLFRAREVNPTADIYGLDWAESACDLVAQSGFQTHRFDMFQPDDFRLDANSVVYTVAAMEQLGQDFMEFVEYLLEQRPTWVVHIEPIVEFLNPTNLLDYLSIQYCMYRGYLNAYWPYLQHLQSEGKIEIVQSQRTYVGSLFVDGYSVIVWRVV